MITYFISDLHLDQSAPKITELFFSFLAKITSRQSELYILGDFFEIWIGDDNLDDFNLEVIKQLKKATSAGLKIYIMHGNRDFLLGKKFFKMTGCKPLPDYHCITIHEKRILLMHGDTLCTDDLAYLKFRRKARNWFIQKIFLFKSLQKRRAIAQRYREKSAEYTRATAMHIMDVTQLEVEKQLKKHRADYLIHGHTHRPGFHQFTIKNKQYERIVLGAWHESASILFEKNNQFQLHEIIIDAELNHL